MRYIHTVEYVVSDRERQISCNIPYMWEKNFKHRNYLQNRDIGVEIKLPRENGDGGVNQEIGIDIYTLLYVKQITNKDPWYSTGNST